MTDIAARHKMRIALKTLSMPEPTAGVLGPPDHVEAIVTLLEHGHAAQKLLKLMRACGHAEKTIEKWMREAYNKTRKP